MILYNTKTQSAGKILHGDRVQVVIRHNLYNTIYIPLRDHYYSILMDLCLEKLCELLGFVFVMVKKSN